MRYATTILLILASLQAWRGEFMGVLFFVVLAVGGHVGSTMPRKP
jgi:hypothetical protein